MRLPMAPSPITEMTAFDRLGRPADARSSLGKGLAVLSETDGGVRIGLPCPSAQALRRSPVVAPRWFAIQAPVTTTDEETKSGWREPQLVSE